MRVSVLSTGAKMAKNTQFSLALGTKEGHMEKRMKRKLEQTMKRNFRLAVRAIKGFCTEETRRKKMTRWILAARACGLNPFYATHKIYRGDKVVSVMVIPGNKSFGDNDRAYTRKKWLTTFPWGLRAYERKGRVWMFNGKPFKGRVEATGRKCSVPKYPTGNAVGKLIQKVAREKGGWGRLVKSLLACR